MTSPKSSIGVVVAGVVTVAAVAVAVVVAFTAAR